MTERFYSCDSRITKHARLIVERSLQIKSGDLFQINAGQLSAPLVQEVYRLALECGAHPFIRTGMEGATEIFYRQADDVQLSYISPIDEFAIHHVDAILNVYGDDNLAHLSNVDPVRQVRRTLASRILADISQERVIKGELRRVLTIYPNHSEAQQAGMSLEQFTDYIYRTIKLDRDDPVAEWKKIDADQALIAAYLEKHDKLEIKAPGIDLQLRVGGRHWINCSGQRNLPDGEIFTGPVEDSVEGEIRFDISSNREGRMVQGVRLVFRKGEVVEASAEIGEEFLLNQINLDEGSKRVGEFSFGTNDDVDRTVGRILVDEKYGGAIHLALGRSLPNSGGLNNSAIHWDFIASMREGYIKADNDICYQNGIFIV